MFGFALLARLLYKSLNRKNKKAHKESLAVVGLSVTHQ